MEVQLPLKATFVVTEDDLMQLLRSGSISCNGGVLRMADVAWSMLPQLRDRIDDFIEEVAEFSGTPVEEWSKLPAGDQAKMPPSLLDNIAKLRASEGDSLSIFCDNPEADTRGSQTAVEALGDWTNWQPRRFYGETWQEAVAAAANDRREAEARDAAGAAELQKEVVKLVDQLIADHGVKAVFQAAVRSSLATTQNDINAANMYRLAWAELQKRGYKINYNPTSAEATADHNLGTPG